MQQKMSELEDPFGRTIDYVRLAVTDRCNLRCFYCMPEEGIDYVDRKALLSYEEMFRLMEILSLSGISKVRVTGGEPFVRKDLTQFLRQLTKIRNLRKISITTNGILTGMFLPELKALGITDINLSLDTIDAQTFKKITRRDDFHRVWETFHQMLDEKFNVKINAVVMEGINDSEILPMCEMTRELPITVRFIEEMPFNGSGRSKGTLKWNYRAIHDLIRDKYPDVMPLKNHPTSTAMNYHIPGHQGDIGIIAAYSRTFCGTCNRIRITPNGQMRTCLYGKNVLDLRQLLREGANDETIIQRIRSAIQQRAKDGFEAEKLRQDQPITESMSTIGG